MTEEGRARIFVKNFGPVIEGGFELRPLTIFIGRNNSGKSYMAQLIYAILRNLSSEKLGKTIFPLEEEEKLLKMGASLREAIIAARTKGDKKLAFKDLPSEVQEIFRKIFERIKPAIESALAIDLMTYLGCQDLRELVCWWQPERNFQILLNKFEDNPPFIRMENYEEKLKADITIPDLSTLSISVPTASVHLRDLAFEPLSSWGFFLGFWWGEIIRQNGILLNSYYLPAARSGVMQGWQALASMAIERVSRWAGLERIEVPPFTGPSLTGVVGDFLKTFIGRAIGRWWRKMPKEFQPALEILEGKIIKGEILTKRERLEVVPRIIYQTDGHSLPIWRASSSVGELVPLDLWIKNVLDPGALLIIEEPEAHLHPEGQRQIARTLVRLVNAGVRVLCTTHSSLILHQISNHLLAGEASPRRRKRVGFTEYDLLRPEEVGVYLFEMPKESIGSRIQELQIVPGFGIPEDEFVRVAEEIGDETYRLTPVTVKTAGS